MNKIDFLRIGTVVLIVVASVIYGRLVAKFGPNMVPAERNHAGLPSDKKMTLSMAEERWQTEQDVRRRWLLVGVALFLVMLVATIWFFVVLDADPKKDRSILRFAMLAIFAASFAVYGVFINMQVKRAFDPVATGKRVQSLVALPGSDIWLRTDPKSILRELTRDMRKSNLRYKNLLFALPVFAAAVAVMMLSSENRAMPLFTPLFETIASALGYFVPLLLTGVVFMLGSNAPRIQAKAEALRRSEVRQKWLRTNGFATPT
jgi:MFS family permease